MTENVSPATSRRRFVQGLAVVGAGGAFADSSAEAMARGAMRAVAAPTELSGDRIDLAIGESAFNVTGRPRIATAVNGSVPGPTLRLREGDTVTLNVTNHMSEPTSIHWHGLRLPAAMDGVPGLVFPGIMPGKTFVYRFPVVQTGTYWYHSHSGMQEQTGLYGPLILEAKSPASRAQQREYVILLSDWTDEDPMAIVSNLKMQGDYYNYHQRTLGTFAKDASRKGLGATLASWSMWGRMRMSPTDIMDVTGATYTFLVNGMPPAANWTGLFEPGERVRLRFINGSSMSTFDVRIPGLPLQVVAADGSDVEPVHVDQFRIGVAETYDVIVQPTGDAAYTIFAQAEDRTGYARGTLAPRAGMTGRVPPMDPRPKRDMTDMGMAGMAGMSGMEKGSGEMSGGGMGGMGMAGTKTAATGMAGMAGMDMGAPKSAPAMAGMSGMTTAPSVNADHVNPKAMNGAINVDNVAMKTETRQDEAGDGLDKQPRRTLVYADLKSVNTTPANRPVDRDIVFHLTGNMERWTWGFDGKKFSQADAIRVRLGERVRFVLVNDTMMEHPIHLHGFLFELENGNDGRLPLKHTVNVKPAERVSFVYTADTPGHWAFHCHLLYHMETGMFRTVLVA
jgi:CopA family copper-resistance protein